MRAWDGELGLLGFLRSVLRSRAWRLGVGEEAKGSGSGGRQRARLYKYYCYVDGGCDGAGEGGGGETRMRWMGDGWLDVG